MTLVGLSMLILASILIPKLADHLTVKLAKILLVLFNISIGMVALAQIPKAVEWGLEKGCLYIPIAPAPLLIGSMLAILLTIATLKKMQTSNIRLSSETP